MLTVGCGDLLGTIDCTGLAVHVQAVLFAYFDAVLSMLVADAKKEGRYSEGVVDVVG